MDSTTKDAFIMSNKCGLLDLAPELRNKIYENCLVNAGPIHLTIIRGTKKVRFAGTRSELVPSILATCRFIHDEASAILYGLNVFDFPGNNSSCIRFLSQCGRSVKHIRHAQIGVPGAVRAHVLRTALPKLKPATSLQTLTIQPRSWYTGPGSSTLNCLRIFLKTLSKARGLEKALDVLRILIDEPVALRFAIQMTSAELEARIKGALRDRLK